APVARVRHPLVVEDQGVRRDLGLLEPVAVAVGRVARRLRERGEGVLLARELPLRADEVGAAARREDEDGEEGGPRPDGGRHRGYFFPSGEGSLFPSGEGAGAPGGEGD